MAQWIAGEAVKKGQMLYFGHDSRLYARSSADRYRADFGPTLTATRDIAENEKVLHDPTTGLVGAEPEHAILPVEFRDDESWRDKPPLL